MSLPHRSRPEDWPELPALADWQGTQATFHMWTQVVGKVRLVQTPWTNHSWHVPLYVTTRGLGSSPIAHGARTFEMDFDLLDDVLRIHTAEDEERRVGLAPRPVADFYAEVMAALDELGLPVRLYTTPSEIADAIPFEEDRVHRHYDGSAVRAFWRALLQIDRVLKEFRAGFIGKCSPVHFFWGSFDMAVTRFSGREAPPHPGGVPNFPDWVAREAYSHEVSSAGFFAGAPGVPTASFYAYAYPAPQGFEKAPVRPAAAAWSPELGEFLLPYDAVRRAPSPDEALLEFLQSTYEAAADLAQWDRAALERELPPPGR